MSKLIKRIQFFKTGGNVTKGTSQVAREVEKGTERLSEAAANIRSALKGFSKNERELPVASSGGGGRKPPKINREGVTVTRPGGTPKKKIEGGEYVDFEEIPSKSSKIEPEIKLEVNPSLKSRYRKNVARKVQNAVFNNKAVKFVRKHPILTGTALAGAGIYNGLSDSDDIDEQSVNSSDNTNPSDQVGLVIDQNGSPYYYDGTNYISDFIQGSDGNIYSQEGQLLGNIGADMNAAGYNNIFDYNAAQRGIDPSQVAAIQSMLGVTPDGKWGAKTQAAFQTIMQQLDNNSLGIPYTTYKAI